MLLIMLYLGEKLSKKMCIFGGEGVVLRFASPGRAGAVDIDRTEAWHTFIMRGATVILRKRGCG